MKKKKIIKIVACFAILLLISGCEMGQFTAPDSCIRCEIGGSATYIPSGIASLTRGIIKLAQLLAPVVIIIMGMIEMIKAIIASDEKQMKDAQSNLIRKIIAGVSIFLVIAIVMFAFDATVFKNDSDEGVWSCLGNFISEVNSETACPGRNSLHAYDNVDEQTGNQTQGGSNRTEDDMTQEEKEAKSCRDRDKNSCSQGYNCCPYYNGSQLECDVCKSDSLTTTLTREQRIANCHAHDGSINECNADTTNKCRYTYSNSSGVCTIIE